MKRVARLIIALVILLSGATLVPAMGLPSQGFNWQLYASAYETLKLFLPLVSK